MSALGRAIIFRQVDVFVERDNGRDRGEGEQFGQGNLHDVHVHRGDSLGFPVCHVLVNQVAELDAAQERLVQELCGEEPVFVVFKHREQGLFASLRFLEAFNGLERESLDDGHVVVPIDTLVFKVLFHVLAIANQLLEHLTPELAVGLVIVFRVLEVLGVDV